jgi:D-aminoacyl-tRNA deacylase
MKINVVCSLKDPVGQTVKSLGYAVEALDEDPISFRYEKGDAVIMICRHSSAAGVDSVTIHHPGNPTNSTYGGEPFTLGISFPSLASEILRRLKKLDIPLQKTFEATHHGPTSQRVPVIFVELGSSERIWRNEKYVKSVVDCVLATLDEKQEKQVAVGFGGGHYAPSFTKMVEELNIGHIISKHQLAESPPQVLKQAVEKSVERAHKVLLDNVNSTIKSKIEQALSELEVEIKRIS